MAGKLSTLRRIQAIHESMIALGTCALPGDSSSLAVWLSAEIELLDQLRGILACAMQLDEHSVIPHARLQTAKEILEASIGAKSIALDLLRNRNH
jgi:hypothetical protein